ncbi:aspartyl/asparaginyl beta-hydroxylase domain-containing protein [Parapedobacter sp. GCM10030251]|uniref:aspartyl/asparaginyl beta-hydroxylase domain-containing protein n=1 Tax=Parapedobacter sp. GCM10030251 TaxID=3273419 RepID=UPI0036128849
MSIICFARLPLVCSPMIKTEIDSYATNWQPHFNQAHYHGEWNVLPLRSPGGHDTPVADLLGRVTYADTVHMQHFPAVAALVRSLDCPVQSVRFLNLKAGADIKPHRDHELAFEKGEARLHFPLVTNPQVEFYVEDTRLDMQPGACWYINANLIHRASNKGDTDRIHLVIDCLVNDWLRELFSRADIQTKEEKIDLEKQKQVIAALRLQNTPTATQLADQLEKDL